jgi:FMN phosphatase YigB (HAD superfamily)
MRSTVRLLVTDLDNTLYDWVTFFAESFSAMVEAAVQLLDVDRDALLDQLRDVHRRYHNSEHPFALLETEAVRQRFADLSRAEQAERLNDAFHAFNTARRRSLRLYPGVLETLQALNAMGTRIVGHTEATVTNAQFRLSKLGLTPYFHSLYAVEHNGDVHPNPARQEQIAAVPRVRLLSQDERKPDPRILMDICRDANVTPAQTLYVGDSIARDIGMARQAGVTAAWARYGTLFDRSAWAILVRVTHWTDDDVRRAAHAEATLGDVKPDLTLDTFSDLLARATFDSW